MAVLALASGLFDHLSVMREYAVNAARFAHELRRHVALALGSLGAAVVVGLPLGIFCHRVPRLREGILGTLNVIQTIPAIALFGILMAPLGALAAALPLAERSASVASARRRRRSRCFCTRCCRSSPTRCSG